MLFNTTAWPNKLTLHIPPHLCAGERCHRLTTLLFHPCSTGQRLPSHFTDGKTEPHQDISPAVGCQPSNYFKFLPKCLGVPESRSHTTAAAKHMSARTSDCLFITYSVSPALASSAFPTSSFFPLLFPGEESPHKPTSSSISNSSLARRPMLPNQHTCSPPSLRLSQPTSSCCLQRITCALGTRPSFVPFLYSIWHPEQLGTGRCLITQLINKQGP